MPLVGMSMYPLVSFVVVVLAIAHFSFLILHRTPLTVRNLKGILATFQTLIAILIVLAWMTSLDPAGKSNAKPVEPATSHQAPDGYMPIPHHPRAIPTQRQHPVSDFPKAKSPGRIEEWSARPDKIDQPDN